MKDSKKNVEVLNTLFNSKKKVEVGKIDAYEYLFYQEFNRQLPNIDNLDLDVIKIFQNLKRQGSNAYFD